jgi:hypothetical protein
MKLASLMVVVGSMPKDRIWELCCELVTCEDEARLKKLSYELQDAIRNRIWTLRRKFYESRMIEIDRGELLRENFLAKLMSRESLNSAVN